MVFIAAAFITGGTSLAAWGALQAGLAGAGIGMLVGGVAQMLMPNSKPPRLQNQDGNKPNHGFRWRQLQQLHRAAQYQS